MHMMQDEFDTWNEQKREIDRSTFDRKHGQPLPKQRGVWMCRFGKKIGVEMNGGGSNFSRPALVIKRFNHEQYWVVPLSTRQKPLDFYLNFTEKSGQPASAVLSQMRLVSVKRMKRFMYTMPEETFDEVRTRLRRYLFG